MVTLNIHFFYFAKPLGHMDASFNNTTILHMYIARTHKPMIQFEKIFQCFPQTNVWEKRSTLDLYLNKLDRP